MVNMPSLATNTPNYSLLNTRRLSNRGCPSFDRNGCGTLKKEQTINWLPTHCRHENLKSARHAHRRLASISLGTNLSRVGRDPHKPKQERFNG